jgi:fumarylpyruvate hydrolase
LKEERTVTGYVIPPPATASLPISTGAQRFPIRRVFCVGRNYAAHAREMGRDPDREPPIFFMKPADAVIEANGVIPYPSVTTEFHHEIEMVVALKAGGTNVDLRDALNLVWATALALTSPAATSRTRLRS